MKLIVFESFWTQVIKIHLIGISVFSRTTCTTMPLGEREIFLSVIVKLFIVTSLQQSLLTLHNYLYIIYCLDSVENQNGLNACVKR